MSTQLPVAGGQSDVCDDQQEWKPLIGLKVLIAEPFPPMKKICSAPKTSIAERGRVSNQCEKRVEVTIRARHSSHHQHARI